MNASDEHSSYPRYCPFSLYPVVLGLLALYHEQTDKNQYLEPEKLLKSSAPYLKSRQEGSELALQLSLCRDLDRGFQSVTYCIGETSYRLTYTGAISTSSIMPVLLLEATLDFGPPTDTPLTFRLGLG